MDGTLNNNDNYLKMDNVKSDLDTLSIYQRDMHFPDEDDVTINSILTSRINKTFWSSRSKLRSESIITREDGIEYPVNNNYDNLISTEIHITLPNVRVKKDYAGVVEICYPRNVGHVITNQGMLCFGDYRLNIDKVWLDMWYQHYRKLGFEDHIDRKIGNFNSLTGWSEELLTTKLLVDQPYSYSRDTRVSFPIFKSEGLKHVYNFRLKLNEILRMRKLENDNWIEIPCDLSYLDHEEMEIPELWNTYGLMTDAQRNWTLDKPYTIFLEDILSFTNESDLNIEVPCKGLFWVAQRLSNIVNNNFSIYHDHGTNPCNGFEIDGEKYETEHGDLSEPSRFPSPPIDPGYNAHYFGHHPGCLGSDISKSHIHQMIVDISDEHILHVRALIYRKLVVTKSNNKNDNKIDYKIITHDKKEG